MHTSHIFVCSYMCDVRLPRPCNEVTMCVWVFVSFMCVYLCFCLATL